MDSRKFDAFTKSLSARLSRRNLFRGTAGLAAATAATRGLTVAAQDAGTTAGSRFTSVRTYAYSGNAEEAASGLQGLIGVMESQPGFIRYEIVAAENNQLLAISTFLDQASAVAAAQQEDSWIQQNAASILPSAPTIASGDVIARSEIDAGCGCITGTQDPCGSDLLVCCQLTDAMGGPGVCLTSATTCPETTPVEPATPPAEPTAEPTEAPCTGEGCNCNTGVEGACDDGLVCCTGIEDAPPGNPGVCRTEAECGCTSEGCHCNGGVEGNCDEGLTCCQDEPMPGGPGTCETTCPVASPDAA